MKALHLAQFKYFTSNPRYTSRQLFARFSSLPCSPNSDNIVQAIDNAVRSFGKNQTSFSLLISNAERYIMATGTVLKSLYPKQFHVTCVVHLLQNCVMKVKSHSYDVDQLIATIKAATGKNKTRQAQFAAIGYLSQPVVTRWESWLNVALYYVNNLPVVKAIVKSFKGVLVTQAI